MATPAFDLSLRFVYPGHSFSAVLLAQFEVEGHRNSARRNWSAQMVQLRCPQLFSPLTIASLDTFRRR
jgi:hypothetical protein